ncbi:Hypothetical predicted protein [Scomber scombrus]|uniref:Uncharacterized protein n=1 Tax=Scomber scombrus TaxID=13677 RepID=A0AAV1N6N5_SCOSC
METESGCCARRVDTPLSGGSVMALSFSRHVPGSFDTAPPMKVTGAALSSMPVCRAAAVSLFTFLQSSCLAQRYVSNRICDFLAHEKRM